MVSALLILFACSKSEEDSATPATDDSSGIDDSVDDTSAPESHPDSGDSDSDPPDSGTGPVDADSDGYTSDVDCDDADAAVHPGVAEICENDADDNCDGSADPCNLAGETSLADADARLLGSSPGESAGTALGGMGDVDGDGIEDFFVGGGDTTVDLRGVVHVVTEAPTGEVDLGKVALAHVRGAHTGDWLGRSAEALGDVDGDGFGDLLIGAMGTEQVAYRNGSAYIVPGPFAGEMDVEDSDSATWIGEAESDYAGLDVAPIGDVTGDGVPDALIGAPFWGDGDEGSAYLVDGSVSGEVSLAEAVARIDGESGDMAGYTVASGGDLTADGVRDVLTGSPQADSARGIAWLFAGPISGTSPVSDADARIEGGAAGDNAGTALLTTDLDADGYDDLLITATLQDAGGHNAGAVYVLNGPLDGSYDLNAYDHRIVGEMDESYFGVSLAADDVDEDGEMDLVVGASGFRAWGGVDGAAYLLYGPITTASTASDAASRWAAEGPGQGAGFAVAVAGDVDGDGWSDLMVGAYVLGVMGRPTAGAAYLIYGTGM